MTVNRSWMSDRYFDWLHENGHYPSFVTLGKFDEFTLFQPTKNQGFNPV
jgi:hypothetical protein